MRVLLHFKAGLLQVDLSQDIVVEGLWLVDRQDLLYLLRQQVDKLLLNLLVLLGVFVFSQALQPLVVELDDVGLGKVPHLSFGGVIQAIEQFQ